MFKLGVFVASLALVTGVSAMASAACNSNSCTGPIKLLYANPGNNTIYVQPDSTMSGVTQCTPPSGKYATMALDTEVKKATWQLLLAAFLAGKSVLIKLNTSGTCVIEYVTVSN